MDPTSVSRQTTTFAPDRSLCQIDSDYESDLGLEIADCQVADEGMGDMLHNSDEEDISQPIVRGRASSQDTIPCEGKPLGVVHDHRELNQRMADDLCNPFTSEADINLASWIVRNKVAKSQIDGYFGEGLGSMDSRLFRFTYTMRQ